MSKAPEYRRYAAEAWRRAWQEPANRAYWMEVAARWMVLAAMAAKSDGRTWPI